jgi:hypothetical protein
VHETSGEIVARLVLVGRGVVYQLVLGLLLAGLGAAALDVGSRAAECSSRGRLSSPASTISAAAFPRRGK